MLKFNKKKIITTKLVGEDLQRSRQRLNLSLKAVEIKIGLATRYVRALENGDWELLPGEIYAKNWLKKYALFLGLDWPELNKKFNQETAYLDIWNKNKQSVIRFGLRRKKFLIWHKIFRFLFLWVLIVSIVFYLSQQIYWLLKSPTLKIVYPMQNFITYNPRVKILGKTDRDVKLSLNDKNITPDKFGWFKVDMILKKGLNIIKVEAKKDYGQSSIVYRRIMLVNKEK